MRMGFSGHQSAAPAGIQRVAVQAWPAQSTLPQHFQALGVQQARQQPNDSGLEAPPKEARLSCLQRAAWDSRILNGCTWSPPLKEARQSSLREGRSSVAADLFVKNTLHLDAATYDAVRHESRSPFTPNCRCRQHANLCCAVVFNRLVVWPHGKHVQC
jgi:hypothetical protein